MTNDASDSSGSTSPFPSRYQLSKLLGRGGGGEVWAAHDCATSTEVAIKALHENHQGAEAEALVRETITLSGLEGLGFPRVLELGRAVDGRLFLVRELVVGQSLSAVIDEDPRRALSLLCVAADVLTVVHRAGFVHGDIKPANMIVRPEGDVALVDLGLAVALREGAGSSAGLTPHYAAPEVHRGDVPSVLSEVYSLGVILRDLLDDAADAGLTSAQSERLAAVAQRALANEPRDRFPSADEFAEGLRAALNYDAALRRLRGAPWPVLGLDASCYELKRRLQELPQNQELLVAGPRGAGVTTLLRRLAWQEAISGRRVVFLDEASLQRGWGEQELNSLAAADLLIVDGAAGELEATVQRARSCGVQVLRGLAASGDSSGPDSACFQVPPLDAPNAVRLLRGALPGMPEEVALFVIEQLGAYPGALRSFVDEAQGDPVASEADVRRILAGTSLDEGSASDVIEACLQRGHYKTAKERLAELDLSEPRSAWLAARYELAAGSAARALQLCKTAQQSGPEEALLQRIFASEGRAQLGLGQYEMALDVLAPAESWQSEAQCEALSYRGLAFTLLGRSDEALATLQRSFELAAAMHSLRLLSLAGASLATAQWRAGHAGEAIESYQSAIEAARGVGDAGMQASSQINLAGLMKERGDLAASIELLESAVDAARRAGRMNSVYQALLNLTNSDLYLGRLERARAQIAEVGDPRQLPPALAAQWHGLVAELAAREDDIEVALRDFAACRQAWEELGRKADAAEAALEACLVAASYEGQPERGSASFVPSLKLLTDLLEHGRRLLSGQRNALLALAEARVAAFASRHEDAETFALEARELAHSAQKREWLWRANALLSRLYEQAGKRTRALRLKEEAIEVLEDIGARLRQDLREVYWSEPRRRSLRAVGRAEDGFRRHSERPVSHQELAASGPGFASGFGVDAVSRLTMTPLERRLARVLAINSDLAGEVDIERLATKIIAHACELLTAERGYLLLGDQADELSIIAHRGAQGTSHQEFSRSIAQEVLNSGKPLVSIDAGRDQRIQAFQSVHLAAVSAVACVPILSPRGAPIGAIYIETRTGARPSFGDEIPTLQAFADQAAIALENARLLGELAAKSKDLEQKNQHLKEARAHLKELLGKRTARLREVKKELRTAKDQLASHASYGQMVGQSEQMRKIYALIERIKDTDVPVLITGESGTGKEVAARAIHEGSARSRGKMLAVNCGAVPENILESELFGHTRGAFTGADRDRKGLFREADGGVLFLDEIGETPLKMQAGLLRVLQEHKVRPVGGATEIPVDVRVVFATNRDLKSAVESGRFREDLLYRIQVVELPLPPLRERREDIPLLCDHFLQRFAARFGQEKKTIAREAMNRLLSYPWPGNIRQLENALLSAWVLSEEDTIEAEDLRLDPVIEKRSGSSPGSSTAALPARTRSGLSSHHRTTTSSKKGTLSEHERSERKKIVDALERTGWNRVKAAQLLDMPRRTFYRRLKEYGIQ